MNEKQIKKTLKKFISITKNQDLNWRLEGSASLKIRGVNTKVNDLDITTHHDEIKKFEKISSSIL